MPFPGHYAIDGTAGVALSTANTGFDSFAGAGTAVYQDGGLAPGSSSHALITGQRNGRSITTGAAQVWTEMWFRQPTETPPAVGADIIILRNYTAADANLSGVQIRDDGKIILLAGRDPESNIVHSERDYTDDNRWLIQHWDVRSWVGGTFDGDSSWNGLPRQFLFIRNKRGKLVEFLMGDADPGTTDRTAVGITNTADATFQLQIDEVLVQPTRPYAMDKASLDRFRWTVTPTGIIYVAQVQGAKYVRVNTVGVGTTVSKQTSLLGYATFDEVSVLAGAGYQAIVEASVDDVDFTPVGDPASMKTVPI